MNNYTTGGRWCLKSALHIYANALRGSFCWIFILIGIFVWGIGYRLKAHVLVGPVSAETYPPGRAEVVTVVHPSEQPEVLVSLRLSHHTRLMLVRLRRERNIGMFSRGQRYGKFLSRLSFKWWNHRQSFPSKHFGVRPYDLRVRAASVCNIEPSFLIGDSNCGNRNSVKFTGILRPLERHRNVSHDHHWAMGEEDRLASQVRGFPRDSVRLLGKRIGLVRCLSGV